MLAFEEVDLNVVVNGSGHLRASAINESHGYSGGQFWKTAHVQAVGFQDVRRDLALGRIEDVEEHAEVLVGNFWNRKILTKKTADVQVKQKVSVGGELRDDGDHGLDFCPQ